MRRKITFYPRNSSAAIADVYSKVEPVTDIFSRISFRMLERSTHNNQHVILKIITDLQTWERCKNL